MKHFETQITLTVTGRVSARTPQQLLIQEGRYPATIIFDEQKPDPTYEQPTRDTTDPDSTYGRNDLYATDEEIEESRQKLMYDAIIEDIRRVNPQTRIALMRATLELLHQDISEGKKGSDGFTG